MKILVITHQDDAHLPFIQKHLEQKLIIFDPSQVPEGVPLTYKWNGKFFEIYFNEVPLHECTAVWFRKPYILESSELPTSVTYQEYAHSSYLKTVQSLYGLLSTKVWVSDYWAILRSNNKLLQLERARELEFLVPETIVTSSPIEAIRFVQSHARVITKMMGTKHLRGTKGTHVFYTTRLDKENPPDFSGLRVAPAIFQEEVPCLMDLRVTVVGSRVFPCAIINDAKDSTNPDWRTGIIRGTLRYSEHKEFPQSLVEACVAMTYSLGLKFGAYDFVMDPEGRYWFLEVNANGQWGFVEEELGLPISEAFIEVFSSV
jgi:hypothetical protein